MSSIKNTRGQILFTYIAKEVHRYAIVCVKKLILKQLAEQHFEDKACGPKLAYKTQQLIKLCHCAEIASLCDYETEHYVKNPTTGVATREWHNQLHVDTRHALIFSLRLRCGPIDITISSQFYSSFT